jgi:UDP-3-O-[3-hydroxymyristoyl] glucosamine N-acyltransferase
MLSLHTLAEALGAKYESLKSGSGPDIACVSGVRSAGPDSIVFAESEPALHQAMESAAAAVITTPKLAALVPFPAKPLLQHAQPRLAFAKAAHLLRPASSSAVIHPTAIVATTANISADVSIGPYSIIGEHVHIGARTTIGSGCTISDCVEIGADCKIHPRTVLYSGVKLGNRVFVHAGCVLGSDGFGYVRDAETGEYTQFPQEGTLIIEDDVEVGANTTIDRGALEETRIERGTKLDNLVHIGHNVRIGRNVIIAAQTGISGSSNIGAGAILGGQVGIGDHADVGPDVILGGGAGVLNKKKLRGAGVVFWGRPAQPLREYLKSLAALARLSRKSKE